ncbi:unnamed protein product [Rotaria sp. Silwood1]|nr:unnamed protein product [Rotaria sp. Silwood1]
MSFVPYFVTAVGSSTLRIVEMFFFSIPKDAERYLNHEINFKEATDGIVKNIHIYVPLTTAKLICDTIVLSTISKWIYDVLIHVRYIFKGLINYGLEAFKNAIKLSLNHIFTSLRSCSIGLILKLMKYWLECMGIIGAVAESNNINFVKYMNKCYSDEIYINNISSLNNEHYLEWKRVKDPDFIRIITVSLEDIFHGKVCNVIVQRKICDINKQIPEIEEARYQVIIEPGCIDGKNISFYRNRS